MNALIRAIGQAGGAQAALAGRIGVSPQQVNQWVKGKRPLPLDRCPLIERATSGAVRCEELRPDVEWQRDAGDRVVGYQVRLSVLGGEGKQVTGNVSSVHGATASRKAASRKTPRVKGRQGEAVRG